MNFQLAGIDPAPFAALFDLDDDALRRHDAVRVTADSDFGWPCRVSLEDAQAGEELLLLPYAHQPAASPYRAVGPIFVRRGATRRVLPAGVVPPYVSRRLISVRAYDAAHAMVEAEVCDGAQVAAELERLFSAARVAYVHLHNARRGCFACVAQRVQLPREGG